ncbi:hypothetical protein TSIB_1950 [Thermococcus sibiricus MM 739]|uniref:Uncharacterized protein n=1 Tax=Thermococcus sibiricus (strain DSM 12597 / MM 739) TaxID=604354 RepID=C6A018_THESM|nr:hypothetical protein TSIB_1950 [Thermococcus sibiricus MM 739]
MKMRNRLASLYLVIVLLMSAIISSQARIREIKKVPRIIT